MRKTRIIIAVLIALATMAFSASSVLASEIGITKNIADDRPYYIAGETIQFVMTVSNPISNSRTNTILNVWDTLPDGSVHYFIQNGVNGPLIQEPGAVEVFTYDYLIPADMSGIKVNVFEADGYDSSPLGDAVKGYVEKRFQVVNPAIDIEKHTNEEDADLATGPMIMVGAPVTWEYIVTNTGNVDLVDIVVTDNLLDTIGTIDFLAAGASESLFAYGTALAGQYENMGYVVGYYEDTAVRDEDPSHYFGGAPAIDIEKHTNGEDADLPTGPMILVGGDVTWEFIVSNTGNVPLENVEVSDDIYGYVGFIGDLAVGASTSLFAYGTAEEDQYENLGTVVGYWEGNVVSDADPSHYFGASPIIDIEKHTNGEDADVPTGPMIPVGGGVIWEYIVNNFGNVDLVDIVVTDDVLGEIGTIDFLAAGTSASLFANGTALEGQYANLGTVVGYWEGHPVSDEDPSHYFGGAPAIDIEKHTNGVDADDPTGPMIKVGDPVTWEFIVTNTGNVDLVDVEVTDDVLGPIGTLAFLAVGDSASLFVDGIAVAGQYENLGTVVGYWEGNPVSDTDPSHYFGIDPAIQIIKYVWDGEAWDDANTPTGPTLLIGSEVTWRYVVTNIGNVPLTGIEVSDNMGVLPVYVSGDDVELGVLELGEVWIYEATGVVIAGQYTNMGKACGFFDDHKVCDEDPANYFGSMDYTGLTPGFWKNHTEEGYWFGYLPSDYITEMFGESTKYYGLGGLTLLETLSRTLKRTGSNAPGILLRAAVAAMLNANHPEINYPMSADDIIAAVQEALNSEDYSMMLMLSEELAGYNELEGVEVTKP